MEGIHDVAALATPDLEHISARVNGDAAEQFAFRPGYIRIPCLPEKMASVRGAEGSPLTLDEAFRHRRISSGLEIR